MNYRNDGRFPKKGDIVQRKSLGQVFLNTDWPVKKMVSILEDLNIKNVIEIGPGNGILTFALANSGINVTAVEKDDRFAERLKNLTSEKDAASNRIRVENCDVLKFDLAAWINANKHERCAVVGNIPYNISTPIIMWMLPHLNSLQLAMFMVQLEFAHRITAKTDTKDYGSLSVYCHLRSESIFEFEVKKDCFTPIPKVDSAVITMKPLEVPKASEKQLQFAETVCRVAFTQRRKKLRNGVKPFMANREESECPIDLNRRAETLTPEDFISLSNFLFQHRI